MCYCADKKKRETLIIETSQEDINSLLLAESNHYKKDAQFIQDAYYKVKQETHIHHPLWSNIQVRRVKKDVSLLVSHSKFLLIVYHFMY